MSDKELQSLQKSEKEITKQLRDYIIDSSHFVDTARFRELIPNASVQIAYQSSITVEDSSKDIYFNLLNIVTITSEKKLKFKQKDSLFESLSFAMRHFGKGLGGEKISNKDVTYSFKFTYPSISFNGANVKPYIIVNLNLKGEYFDYLSLTFVIPFPLSSFYKNSENNIILLNTLNDVIIEKIPDHMTNKSTSNKNFEKDANRFFEILRSWVKQDMPLNESYKKLQ